MAVACALLAAPFVLGAREAMAQAQLADIDPATLAAAEALHREALAALDAKDYATACPKLERVVQMIPEGLGARLTLAECYEGADKLASAWSTYAALEEAAGKAGQRERQSLAKKKVAELRPKLAELTVVVPEAVRALPGLEILRGTHVMDPSEWGTPVPVDASSFLVLVTAPGKRWWEKWTVVDADGAKVTVEVDALRDERHVTHPSPRAARGPIGPGAKPAPQEGSPASAGWGPQRTAGVVMGVAGLVCVGMGAVTTTLDGAGATAASIALFIPGGAAVAGGLALGLTAPRQNGAPQAEVAMGPRGILLRGQW